MPSFKSSARERITTPDSVRRLVDLIARSVTEAPKGMPVSDATIDSHILREQEVVKAYLFDRYGGTSGLKVSTPWYNPVLSLAENIDANNVLTGVTLGSSVITEQWVIKCTVADSEFTLTGSFSGLQTAKGDFTTTDYVSDAPDSDISIAKTAWIVDDVNQIGQGDEFVFSVFLYNPLVVMITDYLAVSATLNQFLSGTEINASDLGQVYYDRAMKLLEQLAKGTLNLSSVSDINVTPEAILYRVDEFGIDSTEYAPDPDTGFRYRTDNVYPPFESNMRPWYRGY